VVDLAFRAAVASQYLVCIPILEEASPNERD
jgi:hypothetical protein